MNDILKKVLPTIATVLGGPLAGLAVEVIGGALGMSEPTKDRVIELLSNTQLSGDQVAALKVAENSLKLRLRELDIKVEELDVRREEIAKDDRVSARTLFQQGFKLIGWLSVLTIIGFFVIVYYMLTEDLSGMSNEQILLYGTMLGYLASNTQQVYNYFFGTSAGSDKKNEMLDVVIKNGNGKH